VHRLSARALDDGDNIMIPATDLNGVGLRTLSSNFTRSAVGNLSIVKRQRSDFSRSIDNRRC
jgi:hypothetical protein